MVIDFGENLIHIRKSNQTFKMNPESTHWTLPVQKGTLHSKAENLVYHVNLIDMNGGQLRRFIKTFVTKQKNSWSNCFTQLVKIALKSEKRFLCLKHTLLMK